MIAAHQEDLRSTQSQGMQVALVPRPLEWGPSHMLDLTLDSAFEVMATDFMDLAQLGTVCKAISREANSKAYVQRRCLVVALTASCIIEGQ
jgi:hypothetical protein